MQYVEMIDVEKEEIKLLHKKYFEMEGVKLLLDYIRSELLNEKSAAYIQHYIKYEELYDHKSEEWKNMAHEFLISKFGDVTILSYSIDFINLRVECCYEKEIS